MKRALALLFAILALVLTGRATSAENEARQWIGATFEGDRAGQIGSDPEVSRASQGSPPRRGAPLGSRGRAD